jgi:P27 family predicted phage terminase small subunit
VIFTEKGYPVQNPLLNVVNKQSDIMKAYLVEFGMTPAARSRVTGDSGEAEEDPFITLVNRKNGGAAS